MHSIYALLLTSLFIILSSFAHAQQSVKEIKVALIGDTAAGKGFTDVLKLVVQEKSDLLMINGDLGYYSSPEAWQKKLLESVDINKLLVIGSLGNHDIVFTTKKYISIFQSFRNQDNGLTQSCSGQENLTEGQDITAVDEVCTFGNVSIVSSAIGQVLTDSYLEKQMDAKLKAIPNDHWKLAGYHYTLASMNAGIKGDEATYKFFDIIRQNGAIGAQAHTHSAMASCPIASEFAKGLAILCHPDFKDIETRFVQPGTGMYLDSSVGGKAVRGRGRCSNPNDTNCSHMVDLLTKNLYTRTDGIKKTKFNGIGAMFIVFNEGGDANKAKVYFKNTSNETIFSFHILK